MSVKRSDLPCARCGKGRRVRKNYCAACIREVDRRDNARRSLAKLAWRRKHAVTCPECGEPWVSIPSEIAYRGMKHCEGCEREQRSATARERTVEAIRLRGQGLTNLEIAERWGVTHHVVATLLYRAPRYGLKAPRSPYWDRGKVAA